VVVTCAFPYRGDVRDDAVALESITLRLRHDLHEFAEYTGGGSGCGVCGNGKTVFDVDLRLETERRRVLRRATSRPSTRVKSRPVDCRHDLVVTATV